MISNYATGRCTTVFIPSELPVFKPSKLRSFSYWAISHSFHIERATTIFILDVYHSFHTELAATLFIVSELQSISYRAIYHSFHTKQSTSFLTERATIFSLYFTSLHFIFDKFSVHFWLFTSLCFVSLHFSMISSTLYFLLIQFNYHFPYPLFKCDCFAGEIS
jgi:hypothetical protein